MKLDVLVVDDQLDNEIKKGHGHRRTKYKLFAEEFNKVDTNFEITLDFAENPISFITKIRSAHYHAIILDAVLNQAGDWKTQNFNINEALKEISEHAPDIPIAIVSSQWDSSNSKQIAEAWRSPNCRTFLHWRDIAKENKGQFDFAWIALRNMVADAIKLDITSRFDPDESIRILHISDIQIGGCDLEHSKAEIKSLVDTILIHWNFKRPAFIALTGDVAEFGDPGQYENARNWIDYLLMELSSEEYMLTRRNVLYVPGNHDVNLSLAAASRIKFEKREKELPELTLNNCEEHQELLHFAYIPFRNFLSAISDCPLLEKDIKDQNFAWVEDRFRHLGVVFYGINTAQPASAFGIPARKVNSDALTSVRTALESILEKSGDNKPVVIGLGHHCPVSASGDRAVENPEVFTNFFQSRVKTALFLHGHTHENEALYIDNDNFRLVRNCAATLTKGEPYRPKDSPRGFTLLELKRENRDVKELEITSFGWISESPHSFKTKKYQLHSDHMFKKNID